MEVRCASYCEIVEMHICLFLKVAILYQSIEKEIKCKLKLKTIDLFMNKRKLILFLAYTYLRKLL